MKKTRGSNVKLGTGILAGGKIAGKGKNKALLQWNNRRFLKRILRELGGFSETLISTAERGNYEDLGLTVVYDEHCGIGPIEGIYQILKHTSSEYVFICGVDMPFINKELVSYMAEFLSRDYDCFCLTDGEHVHPLCTIYSVRVFHVVEELITQGQYRLIDILNRTRTKYILLDDAVFDKRIIKNFNIKDKYECIVLSVLFYVREAADSERVWLIIKLINEYIKSSAPECAA